MANKRYVLGFLFDSDCKEVWLIKKCRPAWQSGRLNGIGGKIEEGELSEAAMIREFQEETGMATSLGEWKRFASLKGANIGEPGSWTVQMYALSVSEGRFLSVRQQEEEEPFLVAVDHIPSHTLPNLHWLIPMAVSILKGHESAVSFGIFEETY